MLFCRVLIDVFVLYSLILVFMYVFSDVRFLYSHFFPGSNSSSVSIAASPNSQLRFLSNQASTIILKRVGAAVVPSGSPLT